MPLASSPEENLNTDCAWVKSNFQSRREKRQVQLPASAVLRWHGGGAGDRLVGSLMRHIETSSIPSSRSWFKEIWSFYYFKSFRIHRELLCGPLNHTADLPPMVEEQHSPRERDHDLDNSGPEPILAVAKTPLGHLLGAVMNIFISILYIYTYVCMCVDMYA